MSEPVPELRSVFQDPNFDPFTDAPRIAVPHFEYADTTSVAAVETPAPAQDPAPVVEPTPTPAPAEPASPEGV